MKGLSQGAALGRTLARRGSSWVDVMRWAGVAPTLRAAVTAARNENMAGAPLDDVYRRLWTEAATELGAKCEPIGGGFLEIRRGAAVTRMRKNLVMLDYAVALELALNKEIGQRLLAARGLPVPEHIVAADTDLESLERFLELAPDGAVVKPVEGFSGRGVTCGVRTRAELTAAARRASGFGRRILMERMALGNNYRLLLLDGELLDVIRRLPSQVRGDGRSSLAQLIRAENDRRLAAGGEEGFGLIRIDLDMVLTLRRAGMTLRSVPAPGQQVRVRTAVNANATSENETISEPISAELISEASAAADALGVRLAGVDIIAPTLSESLFATGGVINEVNTTPALHFHYYVADRGAAVPVAVPILRVLLAAAEARAAAPAHEHY